MDTKSEYADDQYATFAGGCFWCMEGAFAGMPGVISITSGYTGGISADPSYEDVCGGETGHTEAIRIVFDPAAVRYEKLLSMFWHNIDPLDDGGQFADRGSQYRSAVFYHTEEQKIQALAYRNKLDASGRFSRPVTTAIEPAGPFYPAEEYHQEYFRKNPLRYQNYHHGSGRPVRLAQLWGDESGQ